MKITLITAVILIFNSNMALKSFSLDDVSYSTLALIPFAARYIMEALPINLKKTAYVSGVLVAAKTAHTIVNKITNSSKKSTAALPQASVKLSATATSTKTNENSNAKKEAICYLVLVGLIGTYINILTK